MNSKEALEELRDKAQLLALFMGKDAGNHLVNVDTLYNTIKQDLERLEVLEKENQQLLVNKNVAQALAIKVEKENEKLKKAIEIIKSKVELELNLDEFWKGIRYHLWSGEGGCEITQQEYELLKEVLEE